MRSILTIGALVALLAQLGCSSAQAVADHNRDRMARLVLRAAFDLDCPRDEVQVDCLGEDMGGYCHTAGATGCGARATYVRGPAGGAPWTMDSGGLGREDPSGEPATEAPAPAPAPAPAETPSSDEAEGE